MLETRVVTIFVGVKFVFLSAVLSFVKLVGDMALTTKGIFIVGAKRTPFCRFGGAMGALPAGQAFAAAAAEVLRAAALPPALVDATIVGNVNFLSQCDGGKTARYCGLYAGVPVEKPALGVNKACGSGLQAVITGAVEILTGTANVILTGGTEITSSLPLLVRNARFKIPLGSSLQLEDYLTGQALDSYTGLTLQELAEGVARDYGLTREEVDDFALASCLKWKAAQDSGIFKREISQVTVEVKRQQVTVDRDELPDRLKTREYLGALPAVVDNGAVVTVGNSAAPADGAAALLLASEDSVQRHNLTPLARLTGWACVGVDPKRTGLAAVLAARELERKTRVKVDRIDMVEINETFASQTLASARELNVDPDRLNVSGGALAMGHPIAATGARMATHLVYELGRRNLKTAMAVSSCGGGQGIAIMLERV